jgi:putative lipoic acid-binding regulatory protein
MPDPQDSLLTFPCDFPLKVMGEAGADFVPRVVEVVTRHAPDFDPASVTLRDSSAGRYVGLTCTLRATSRAQLDALYRELSAHPSVKVVL